MKSRMKDRMKDPRLALPFVFLIGGASILTGGCGPAAGTDVETVHLKISGSCGSGVSTFDMTRYAHGLSIDYGGATSGYPLPHRGVTDEFGHSIREGGWRLWGCLYVGEPCFDTFRYCTAKREAWQLNVSCLDGTGAPVCQAILTE